MNDEELELTYEETVEGWHFCLDWDGLLVGPGMHELEYCNCLPKDGRCIICEYRQAMPNIKVCHRCKRTPK